MPDASVISRNNVKPRELNQGGTSTSLTIFTSDGTTPVICPLPNAAQLAAGSGTSGYSSIIMVRAWGRVTGGTTTNYTVTLQYGTSATSGNNTTMFASTARAVNSVSSNWEIFAECTLDDVSQKICGRAWAQVNNNVDSPAALTTAPTSVDTTSTTQIGFVIGGTFSSGNASNAAYLDGFEIIR